MSKKKFFLSRNSGTANDQVIIVSTAKPRTDYPSYGVLYRPRNNYQHFRLSIADCKTLFGFAPKKGSCQKVQCTVA